MNDTITLPIKFKVESQLESTAIQKQLFRLGCRWTHSSCPTDIKHMNCDYLFVDRQGLITWGSMDSTFSRTKADTCTLVRLVLAEKIEAPEDAVSVTIEGVGIKMSREKWQNTIRKIKQALNDAEPW